MSLDPNIILAGKPATLPSYYENQINQSNLDSALQTKQMNQMKIDAANLATTNSANLKNIYGGYTGNNADLTQKLIQSGNADDAIKMGNYGTEQTTKNLANTQTTGKIVSQVAGAVANVPPDKIHDAASQGIDYLLQNGIYTPDVAAQAKAHIATLQPEELRTFSQQTHTQGLSPEQQLPKVGIENLGGTSQPYAQSPITGMTTNAGLPMTRTQTPEQAAKAPEVKTMKVGTNEESRQWNPDSQTWTTIASGAAFKPDAVPMVIDPDNVKANAGMLKTGMPMAQVVPGYGSKLQPMRDAVKKEAITQIMADNPSMSLSDAGNELANRNIDFVAGKRSVGQLTTMQGATKQAVSQLDFNIDKTNGILKSIPSSDLSPIINAIARGEEKWTGDPQYSSLFFYMSATAMESARILQGGQASSAQLHQGAAEEARKWANVNMTPASFAEVGRAMHDEGVARLQTYKDAIDSQRGKNSQNTPATQSAQPTINGTKMMSKSGKPMVRVNGQWEYQ